MKKLLITLLLIVASTSMAFAQDATKIKLRINGASPDNKYFLCSRAFGCFSILGGQRGKVYPVFRPVNVGAIFVMDKHTRKIAPQGVPASCQGEVSNKTITITGQIGPSGNVSGLRCSIS